MLYTSSYNNWSIDNYITYSISGDGGKSVNYQGRCYPKLAPKYSFWKIWYDNIGKVSEKENNRYYVQEYWNQVLSKLDPEEVYKELEYSVLLCYESEAEFCHRHIVAAWFEILLDIKVPEKKNIDFKIEEVERPLYIKNYLEDAMKQNINMRGFNSIRALYLFDKGEKLESLANKLEKQNNKGCEWYRQAASYFRCNADMVETEYNSNRALNKSKK